eukprot:508595-Prorocentrum_minimum.AAC.1
MAQQGQLYRGRVCRFQQAAPARGPPGGVRRAPRARAAPPPPPGGPTRAPRRWPPRGSPAP